jgi:competence protein ComEA
VLVIVAAGLLVAAWWLARAAGMGGAPGEVAPPRPVTGAATAPADGSPAPASPSASHPLGSPTSSSSAGAEIVVDVVGRVRDPGIAVLPAGSRVVDAVRAAGGMKPGVDRDTVNLARPLNDGEQVLVGVAGGSGAGPPVVTSPSAGVGGAPATLVNLNTADQATLETLPGVGPVTAQAILQWRAEHGGFTAVDELLEVSGIGDATLAEIAPHVTV